MSHAASQNSANSFNQKRIGVISMRRRLWVASSWLASRRTPQVRARNLPSHFYQFSLTSFRISSHSYSDRQTSALTNNRWETINRSRTVQSLYPHNTGYEQKCLSQTNLEQKMDGGADGRSGALGRVPQAGVYPRHQVTVHHTRSSTLQLSRTSDLQRECREETVPATTSTCKYVHRPKCMQVHYINTANYKQ